jgi:predicted amidophosphoribosyltransferase
MFKDLISLLRPQHCKFCFESGDLICYACQEKLVFPASGRCSVVFRHNPEAVKLVIQWKDRGQRELTNVFAAVVADSLKDEDLSNFALAPIPERIASFKKRGWRPVARLAEKLGSITNLPVDEHAFRFKVQPSEQRGLSPNRRYENIAGIFQYESEAPKLLIIDDVFTTGATLFSAIRAAIESKKIQPNDVQVLALVASRKDYERRIKSFLEIET